MVDSARGDAKVRNRHMDTSPGGKRSVAVKFSIKYYRYEFTGY